MREQNRKKEISQLYQDRHKKIMERLFKKFYISIFVSDLLTETHQARTLRTKFKKEYISEVKRLKFSFLASFPQLTPEALDRLHEAAAADLFSAADFGPELSAKNILRSYDFLTVRTRINEAEATGQVAPVLQFTQGTRKAGRQS